MNDVIDIPIIAWSKLEPDERDIITYTRQLLRTNRVEQNLVDALIERHSVRWLVELTATIAWENASSKFNRALRVPSQQLWQRADLNQ